METTVDVCLKPTPIAVKSNTPGSATRMPQQLVANSRPGWNSSTKSKTAAVSVAPSSIPVASVAARKLSLPLSIPLPQTTLSASRISNKLSTSPSVRPSSTTPRSIPNFRPNSASTREHIPPAAEHSHHKPSVSRQSLRPTPFDHSASTQQSSATASNTPTTVTQVMAGVTSKGVGKTDLPDQYQAILVSKNPSERSMRSNLRALRHLILTQGIPNSFSSNSPPQDLRCRIWKLLLGVYRTSADEYVQLVGKGPSDVFDKIKNDAFRTLMGDKGFGKAVDEGMLIRILNAFVWRAKDYPTSRLINLQFSYVQGMNVLAAPFLFVMPELDAFYSFAAFIQHMCPLYVQPALEGVHCGIKLLDKCLLLSDPSLHAFLKSKSLDPVMYAFPSVMTFSACTPPLNEVLKLWDFLLSYGIHLNIICIVAQLVLIRTDIMKSSSPMKVLRTFPKLDAKKVVGMCMKLLELIPDSLYDLLVRHAFDAIVCDGILNDD